MCVVSFQDTAKKQGGTTCWQIHHDVAEGSQKCFKKCRKISKNQESEYLLSEENEIEGQPCYSFK